MGIRKRLLLSFLLLFAVVFGTAAGVATWLVAGAVERRLEEQTRDLARLFAENPEWARGKLAYVERAYGAQSATVGPVGRVPPGEGVFRERISEELELVMVWSPEVISGEKARTVRPFALVAVGGLLLVLLIGTLTAHALARPIEELSRQARALPGGAVRPVGGGAEVAHLVEALNRMLGEVRRAERLGVMGRMAAGVAHEIRNPLASMKLTVQMLREGVPDREPYDRLLREIERLELTTAELTGASQPLRKERVRLEKGVEEVLDLMRLQLDHLSVRVERRLGPAPEVEVDVARFKRCVMNLVLNGAQAGGPLVVEVAPRNGRVRFAVTDSGGGVPEPVKDRIFDPFVTTKQDGVGLGLALTRAIVEEHGGAIGFDPVPGGTTFWIDLEAARGG